MTARRRRAPAHRVDPVGRTGVRRVSGGGFGGGPRGGAGAASAIQAWQANYPATTVGGTTVYRLTG